MANRSRTVVDRGPPVGRGPPLRRGTCSAWPSMVMHQSGHSRTQIMQTVQFSSRSAITPRLRGRQLSHRAGPPVGVGLHVPVRGALRPFRHSGCGRAPATRGPRGRPVLGRLVRARPVDGTRGRRAGSPCAADARRTRPATAAGRGSGAPTNSSPNISAPPARASRLRRRRRRPRAAPGVAAHACAGSGAGASARFHRWRSDGDPAVRPRRVDGTASRSSQEVEEPYRPSSAAVHVRHARRPANRLWAACGLVRHGRLPGARRSGRRAQRLEQSLRPGRTPGHVDVDRDDLVDALGHRVGVPVRAAAVGAGAVGDDVRGSASRS